MESIASYTFLKVFYVNCFHVGVDVGTSLTYEPVLFPLPTRNDAD